MKVKRLFSKRENRSSKEFEMRSRLQKYFPEWFPVARLKTSHNNLEIILQNNRLVLNAPHTNYSFGTLHEVFRSAFRQLNLDYQEIENVLILGFGAGSVAWILQQENHCPCHITGVEVDNEVISLAKKYFRFNELENLNLHIADASHFLPEDTKQYDLIVVDLFLDHRTPERFLSVRFLKELQTHIRPHGIVLFNYLRYDFEAKEKAMEFEKSFRKIFQQVRPLTFKKQPKNIVFTGRKRS